jgi:very-short-patch-repair endonuclease
MTKKQEPRSRRLQASLAPTIPHVVNERSQELVYPKSRIRVFAEKNAKKLTKAEHSFEFFLFGLNGGVLKKRYKRQHVVSGKWIVDFFFPEIRLAIEIDGPSHQTEEQAIKDMEKDADCANLDITVVRITNSQVFGDPDNLLQLLREAWKLAKARKNRFIGKPYEPGREYAI